MINVLRALYDTLNLRSFTVSLRKQYPDVYAWVNDQPDIIPTSTFVNKVYTLLYPEQPICENTDCANLVTTLNRHGWAKYCSMQCKGQHNSLKSRDKAKETSQLNWGVDNPAQSDIIQDKMKSTMLKNHGVEHALQSEVIYSKRTATMLERHGVEHAACSPTIQAVVRENWKEKFGVDNPMKVDSVKAKQIDTCLTRFGTEYAQQNSEVRKRTEATNIERFGFKCPFQNASVKAKSADTIYRRYGVQNVSQSRYIHGKKLNTSYRTKQYTLPSGIVVNLQGNEPQVVDRLLDYFNESYFLFECETFDYMLDNKGHVYLPDFEILGIITEVKSTFTFVAELGKNLQKFNAVINTRGKMLLIIMDQKGLMQTVPLSAEIQQLANQFDNCEQTTLIGDICVNMYFPEEKLAIRFFDPRFENNKLYPDIQYKNKLFVELADKGIQLLFIDINYLHNNKDTLLNTIKAKVGCNTEKLFARKCEIKKISVDVARKFYNTYHMQGFAGSTYHYGLFYRDQLVSTMSFSTPRKGIGRTRPAGSYELVRFCSSVQVLGGASKLLKQFIRDVNPSHIYSFSSNFYSAGCLYRTLGFTLEAELPASYSYLAKNSQTMEHRFKYAKHKLRNMPYYSELLSEKEIMEKNGYVKVYDAGKRAWVLNL